MSIHSFQTKDDARQWVRGFLPELKRPCLVLLSGDLGAGKTQMVRWFLEELGVNAVASPTFAIHHQYAGAHGARIDHVDLYRVQNDADLEGSGFWDLLSQPNGLLFVEWADRLPDSVWPKSWRILSLHLRKGEGGEAREMELSLKTP